MHMSAEAFGDYAAKLEREDFEDDIRSLNVCTQLLSVIHIYNHIADKENMVRGLYC